MSHLSPEDRSDRHRRSACRKGRHLYGAAQNIGGGIVRQVCDSCGEVTIDLTRTHSPTTASDRRRARFGSFTAE